MGLCLFSCISMGQESSWRYPPHLSLQPINAFPLVCYLCFSTSFSFSGFSLSLSHGESSTLLQESPKKRTRARKAPRAAAAAGSGTRFCDGGGEIDIPVGGSREVGLPRAEEDNPVRAVAPQSGRGCLRSTQRGPRRPSHRLGRSLRLARLRPPRRSQQDQRRILLQRSGTLRYSRCLVFSHRLGLLPFPTLSFLSVSLPMKCEFWICSFLSL